MTRSPKVTGIVDQLNARLADLCAACGRFLSAAEDPTPPDELARALYDLRTHVEAFSAMLIEVDDTGALKP